MTYVFKELVRKVRRRPSIENRRLCFYSTSARIFSDYKQFRLLMKSLFILAAVSGLCR
jgi:hypothetical protein